jgi:hypothetical protein
MSQKRNDRPTSREIERDDTLVLGDLLRNIGRLLLGALDTLLLGGPALDASTMQTQLAELLDASNQHSRRLNDARILRRGQIRPPDASTSVPEAARPFLRHGEYLGSFPTLQALAARTLALDGLEVTTLARLDLTGLGLDLHLHGIVWTITADGQLHAFRPHPHQPRESP